MTKQPRTDGIPGASIEAALTAIGTAWPDALFVLDDTGRVLHANAAAGEFTTCEPDALIGRTLESVLGDDMLRYLDTLTGDGRTATIDSACAARVDKSGAAHADTHAAGIGESIPVRITARAFDGEGGRRILAIMRDRRDIVQMEQDIAALRDQLRHAHKMAILGELTGGISHYFNNIFTGLAGTLAMIRRDVPEKAAALVKQAETSAGRAAGFTRRLLTVSRATEVVKEPTDVGALIDEVEEFARMTLDTRIEFTVHRAKRLDTVLSDSAALHHVLLNLLTNARDTLNEKERTVKWEPKLAISIEAENVTIAEDHPAFRAHGIRGRFVKIAVADTGCGIDENTRRRIFEPFFTTKEAGRGTGLGLSTAMQTVCELGGVIDVASRPGVGSTFTLYLPVTSLKRSITRDDSGRELPRGSETVLLVDDDELIRSFAAMALERQGYTVLSANDGRECLDRFMADCDRIGLVVLDLVLPGIPGREVLKKLRRIRPDVRVIVSSGHVFDRDRDVFADLNADDYILKPYTVADLAESVRNVLDRKPSSS